MDYLVWLNGKFIPRSEAKIPITDRGFRMSDVVYDTLRTFNGKLFKVEEHLERFARTLKYVRIDPGISMAELERLLHETVKRNEPMRRQANDDYMVSPIVTRGSGYPVHLAKNPTVSIFIDPIDFVRYAPIFHSGGSAIIPKVRTTSPQQIDPKAKNFSRLNFVLADLEATDIDPDAFPVLLDLEGNVAESIGSNFFIVSGGVVRAPRDNSTLQGVSRATVFELCDQLGIPTAEESIQPYDVYNADEAFISSTPYCILPIGRVDKRDLNMKAPGPITTRILAAWGEMVGLDIVDQADRRAKALTIG
ncbi:MAG: branched-chain amino acid aminotransferase [SAR202 cluster bacterium]|nr:branched-chain amino acid aminotransferase [SAR202 cluster bacterium]